MSDKLDDRARGLVFLFFLSFPVLRIPGDSAKAMLGLILLASGV
jgi:hypothetical protein